MDNYQAAVAVIKEDDNHHNNDVVDRVIDASRTVYVTRKSDKVKLEHDFMTQPIKVGSSLIFVDREGRIVALDAKSKVRLWLCDDMRCNNNMMHPSIEAFADNKVLVFAEDGSIIALDAENGRFLWKSEVASAKRGKAHNINDNVVFAAASGAIYVLDSKNGEVIWSVLSPRGDKSQAITLSSNFIDASHNIASRAKSDVETKSVEAEGVIYKSTKRGIEAFNCVRNILMKKWENEMDSYRTLPVRGNIVSREIVSDDSIVYAYNGTESLVAMNASDGKLMWSKSIEVSSKLHVDSRGLWFMSGDALLLLNQQGDIKNKVNLGKTLSRYQKRKKYDWTSPYYQGNMMIIGERSSGSILVFDLVGRNALTIISTERRFKFDPVYYKNTIQLFHSGGCISEITL